MRRLSNRRPWPPRVSLVAFDFDGVMTDNSVWVSEDGTEMVRCSRADGLGLSLLRAAGFSAMVLSTETNPVVEARCRKLRLPVVQACDDKAAYLAGLLDRSVIDPASVVFVGNDVNDLGCLDLVGCPVAVADAVDAVRRRASWVTKAPGGQGAVREVCDFLLERSTPTSTAAPMFGSMAVSTLCG